MAKFVMSDDSAKRKQNTDYLQLLWQRLLTVALEVAAAFAAAAAAETAAAMA